MALDGVRQNSICPGLVMFVKLRQRVGPSAIARFYNNYTASWMVFFKRFEPAIRRYEDSVKLYPKDERAKHCLANLHVQTGQSYSDTTRALQLFDELIAENPANASYPFNAAFVMQKQAEDALGQGSAQARHGAACALFEQALAVDKNHDRAWYGLALSRMALGDWAAAQIALEHNTRLQPMSPYGWYQLAVAQAQQGHWDAATLTGKHLMGFEPKFARGLLADLKMLKKTSC